MAVERYATERTGTGAWGTTSTSVFCCKYCGTTYAIGTMQQNSTY